MDDQSKKGILEMCLLLKLAKKDYYGYELMKEMNLLFPDVNESTFYAILRRLKKEGFAVQYQGEVSGGPARKYYKLSPGGERELDKKMQSWEELCEIVEQLR